MIMPAQKNRAQQYVNQKTMQPNVNYQDLTIEESSFNQKQPRKFDNQVFFDPKWSNQRQMTLKGKAKQVKIDLTSKDEGDWEVKTTSKGFLYFKLKGTND